MNSNLARSISLACTLLVSVFLTACGGEQTPQLVMCDQPVNTSSPVLNNGFGFNLNNTRNQPSPINSSNVANLELDFTLNAENAKERRGAPAVTQQTIYYHTPDSVDAVDRETGCLFWTYDAPDRVRSASVTLVDEPTLRKRIIVVGTWTGLVIALDARTGTEVWRVDAREFDTNMITGGIQYHNGRLYVPLATKSVILAVTQFSCCESHGSLVALNSANGNEVWRFHSTEEASRVNINRMAPNGVSIWSTPLLDVARNQIIIGTAQNLTQPTTAMENSVVAINMNNGSVNWVFQATANDAYNATCDVTGEPINQCDGPDHDWDVITALLTKTSAGDDIIIAGDKKGSVYQLNPSTGEVNWETRLGAGGKLGGIHWGMAVDNNQIYAGVADVTAAKSSVIDSALGTDIFGWTSLEVPMIQVPNAMPGIYALNKDTGAINWEIHDTHFYGNAMVDSIYSAALSVTNDVLFAASLDGVVKAFRTSNGDELWSFNTAISITDLQGRTGNGGTIEGPGPIIAGDNVLVNSGYNTFGGTNEFQAGPGNALFVFKLR
ncbi:MAG: PQQ-binding-like beta-propeller repeat protein [Ketobacter sp.]|nr:PQQ-binding-like beta-propeller repeat protein [Ketobacter sp.]